MKESLLPRSTPQEAGVDSNGILKFVEGMEKGRLGPHSFMLLRHGRVVAEGWWKPFKREDPHLLYSLSKSFTSSAVGIAIGEGLVSLDDPVTSFFPEEVPRGMSDNLSSMRIRHLLSMSCGHEEEPLLALHGRTVENWVREFLAHPVPRVPGTHFVYNSASTYMCSAILQRVTGLRLIDYLRPSLFQPLGIGSADWETCPRGVDVGGWGLSVTTESIAKLGQLYLQQGLWSGRQLLPIGWVEEASRSHVSNGEDPLNDWNQGYGFQFWRCRHNCYRGDGAFGQNCVVMPDHNAVLVTTASNPDLGATLQLAWDHLLPAMRGTRESLPLSPTLQNLEVAMEGDDDLSSVPCGVFHGGGSINEVTLARSPDLTIEIASAWPALSLKLTPAEWTDQRANINGSQANEVSARATIHNGELVVKVVETRTPLEITIRLKFVGDDCYVTMSRFGDFRDPTGPSGVLKRVS